MEVNTDEDGWDCEPKLKEAVDAIDEMSSDIYEIKHCVRSGDLEDMVVRMKEQMEAAIEILDSIDVDVEYVTVEDEE
jgi:hypothetical protein